MLAKLLDDSWDSHYACFLSKMVIEGMSLRLQVSGQQAKQGWAWTFWKSCWSNSRNWIKICSWLICNFPTEMKVGLLFSLKVFPKSTDQIRGCFFLESWWRFFFGRISLFKTVPCKIEIRIFPGTDIWVEVSRKVHTASWAIHGAIQESLEIMLDNVTWQTLSTWVRTCHVSHVRTWRCNDVQHFLNAFDQPLMLRESTQHALLP